MAQRTSSIGAMAEQPRLPVHCSFCKKLCADAGPLVAGSDGVYICLECAQTCTLAIQDAYEKRANHESAAKGLEAVAELNPFAAPQHDGWRKAGTMNWEKRRLWLSGGLFLFVCLSIEAFAFTCTSSRVGSFWQTGAQISLAVSFTAAGCGWLIQFWFLPRSASLFAAIVGLLPSILLHVGRERYIPFHDIAGSTMAMLMEGFLLMLAALSLLTAVLPRRTRGPAMPGSMKTAGPPFEQR